MVLPDKPLRLLIRPRDKCVGATNGGMVHDTTHDVDQRLRGCLERPSIIITLAVQWTNLASPGGVLVRYLIAFSNAECILRTATIAAMLSVCNERETRLSTAK